MWPGGRGFENISHIAQKLYTIPQKKKENSMKYGLVISSIWTFQQIFPKHTQTYTYTHYNGGFSVTFHTDKCSVSTKQKLCNGQKAV